ncbi:flagellar associated protein [Reticulomyxa filosa]|uniref:Flagellar associated protein n=1 Tax=Reticulomyxa filosa TaxID=46433 RepID=X6NRP0_RETFI|nr:flagellar associated protein [Reticulomyxa filosa]|eukprot:ETO28691.1 flagellar associated protein [Reticulomyxa filosa]
MLKEYEKMIQHLRKHGAILSIKPEHCLSLHQYLHFMQHIKPATQVIRKKKGEEKTCNGAQSTTKQWIRRKRRTEKLFPLLSCITWSNVLFQIIKIYVMNKELNLKKFLQMDQLHKCLQDSNDPMALMLQSTSSTKDSKFLPFPDALNQSNVFSSQENLLLLWASFCYNQHIQPTKPHYFNNFRELSDGVAAACTLISYVPHLSSQLSSISRKPADHNEKKANWNIVLNLLKKLGLHLMHSFGVLQEEDLVNSGERNMCLFWLHLYTKLPMYAPFTVIDFPAKLNNDVTRTMRLSNPCDREIVYEVMLEGDPQFHVESNVVILGPRQLKTVLMEEETKINENKAAIAKDTTLTATNNVVPSLPSSKQEGTGTGAEVVTANTEAVMKDTEGKEKEMDVDSSLHSCEKNLKVTFSCHFNKHCNCKMILIPKISSTGETYFPFAMPRIMVMDLRTSKIDNSPLQQIRHSGTLYTKNDISILVKTPFLNIQHMTEKEKEETSEFSIECKDCSEKGDKRKFTDVRLYNKIDLHLSKDDVYKKNENETKEKFKFNQKQQTSRKIHEKVQPNPANDSEESDIFEFPCPWLIEKTSLKLKNDGAPSKLNLIFVPFNLTQYKCQIRFKVSYCTPLLLFAKFFFFFWESEQKKKTISRSKQNKQKKNPDIGEFIYEIIGDVLLPSPEVIKVIRSECLVRKTISQQILVPFDNMFLTEATNFCAERSLPHSAKKLRTKNYNETKPLVPSSSVYQVFCTSPYYHLPKYISLSKKDTEAKTENEGAPQITKNKEPSKTAQTTDEIQTDSLKNQLTVQFTPYDPGIYPCTILLQSQLDLRVYYLEFTAKSEGSYAELEFTTTANEPRRRVEVSAHLNNSNFSGEESILIAPKSTSMYRLAFTPDWIGKETGQLALLNYNTDESYVYKLTAYVTEPAAIGLLTLYGKARSKIEHTVEVLSPFKHKSITYQVESDLPNIYGEGQISIPHPNGKYQYTFGIIPMTSGVTKGSLTFIDNTGKFQWFAIVVNSTPSEPEDCLQLRTYLRELAAVEIDLKNPLEEMVEFEVEYKGSGLFGDSKLRIHPQQETTYTLHYFPSRPGKDSGLISFRHDSTGEFWYKLDLEALVPPPKKLKTMLCAIGNSSV